MRPLRLLTLPAAALLAVAAVPVGSAVAADEDSPAKLVLDLPPDFVRFGTELPLSGTVLGLDGRRAVRSPVAVATWDANLEEFTWGRTVVTDANGRFRTSVKATAANRSSRLLAPLLNGEEDDPSMVKAAVPLVPLQYPVSLTVKKDPTDPTKAVVSGTSPECDGATIVVETATRAAFQPVSVPEPVTCEADKFTASVPRPVPGAGQYRVRRLGDDLSVTSVSSAVSLR